ncbi:unnamed protein product [marine sediment metagenome]|uniref:Uncharacterized protein n=1 Tax=marine sediment metagenome TaxID=412755 RepID=X1RZB8_9ZZZZ
MTFVRPDPTVTEEGFLSINFGRYLYDKELAFDPSRFDNPQIQITTNYNTVEALCTADHFAIQAYIMEGLGTPPRGFLLTKELKSWLASAAWEYTQMPKDYVYRRLFLQALEPNVALQQFWTQAILQEDNYARIPFDVLRFNQIADNARDYGELMEHCAGEISAVGDYFFGSPTYSPQLDAVNAAELNALRVVVEDGGRFNVISASTTDMWRGTMSGYCPQGMVVFNLGPKDVIEDWYNPREVGNLLLEVLGVAAHTIHLVTEQLRPY